MSTGYTSQRGCSAMPSASVSCPFSTRSTKAGTEALRGATRSRYRKSSKHFEDQFSYSQVNDVEQGDFSFTKPPHDATNWGKIVEPVVVSGIIVGLIYLFFSNQTDE